MGGYGTLVDPLDGGEGGTLHRTYNIIFSVETAVFNQASSISHLNI